MAFLHVHFVINRLFKECEKYGRNNQHKSDNVVPQQRFVIEYRYRDNSKDRQGNRFLDDFQLHQAEGTAIDFAANGVGGNHEEIFDERDTPRSKNDKDERPVGADVHFLELEVAVPGGGHEHVTDDEKDYCNDSGFHIFSCWLVVGAQAVGLSGRVLVGEAGADLL